MSSETIQDIRQMSKEIDTTSRTKEFPNVAVEKQIKVFGQLGKILKRLDIVAPEGATKNQIIKIESEALMGEKNTDRVPVVDTEGEHYTVEVFTGLAAGPHTDQRVLGTEYGKKHDIEFGTNIGQPWEEFGENLPLHHVVWMMKKGELPFTRKDLRELEPDSKKGLLSTFAHHLDKSVEFFQNTQIQKGDSRKVYIALALGYSNKGSKTAQSVESIHGHCIVADEGNKQTIPIDKISEDTLKYGIDSKYARSVEKLFSEDLMGMITNVAKKHVQDTLQSPVEIHRDNPFLPAEFVIKTSNIETVKALEIVEDSYAEISSIWETVFEIGRAVKELKETHVDDTQMFLRWGANNSETREKRQEVFSPFLERKEKLTKTLDNMKMIYGEKFIDTAFTMARVLVEVDNGKLLDQSPVVPSFNAQLDVDEKGKITKVMMGPSQYGPAEQRIKGILKN